eukprot:TRINITY_DN18113_c0_g1_i1.p1 TRINITY_DN18113_c0_g1~~TRINITY_DN18113_c0_g1_i1.p1  ORF type:complete len:203 (-),score=53.31 TRINITY_DN18113_c0_g1_i1:372-980(-)
MSDALFTETERLRDVMATIGSIDASKLRVVLQRVAGALHQKTGYGFSEAEEAQIIQVLDVSSATLQTVMEGATFIFERAAYDGVAGEGLTGELKSVGMSEAAADSFGEVWQEAGAGAVQALKDRPMGGTKVVSSVNWDLLVRVADASTAESRAPVAVLQLGLKEGNNADAQDEIVSMEMSHAKLSEMFLNLETIQEQLDALQ